MLQRCGADRSAVIDDFEWVNAWAAQAERVAPVRARPLLFAIEASPSTVGPTTVHMLESAFAADAMKAASALEATETVDQLTCDIVAIERARDALLAGEDLAKPKALAQPVAPIMLRRTPDSVPVVLGSVLGVLMLVVFSAAAVFVKLAR